MERDRHLETGTTLNVALVEIQQLINRGHAFGSPAFMERWQRLHTDLARHTQRLMNEAFGEGFQHGRARGCDEGFGTGYDAGQKASQDEIRRISERVSALDAENASLRSALAASAFNAASHADIEALRDPTKDRMH